MKKDLSNAPYRYRFDQQFDEPTIFVASSSDVDDVRKDIVATASRLLRRAALSYMGQPLSASEWRDVVPSYGLKQTAMTQTSIPLMSSPNCRGLIAVLGELIGTPFPPEFVRDYAANHIIDFDGWTAEQRFQLRIDWPNDPVEAMAAVDSGQYPLTGTVFEYLNACSIAGTPQEIPVWIGYLASEAITQGSQDKYVVLNQNLLLRNPSNEIRGRDTPPARSSDWETTFYNIQTGALKNFVAALRSKGNEVSNFRSCEHLLQRTEQFIRDSIIGSCRGVNPYTILATVEDLDRLIGREDEVQEAHNIIRRCWNGQSDDTRRGLKWFREVIIPTGWYYRQTEYDR